MRPLIPTLTLVHLVAGSRLTRVALLVCTVISGVLVQQSFAGAASVSSRYALPQPLSYSYDANGRLTSLIDPATHSAASYAYDAAGNLLSVTSSHAGAVSVSGFSPLAARPGSPLTIWGAGFGSNIAKDRVRIGRIPARVVAASPTRIVAVMPDPAFPGRVSVATGLGTATTTQTLSRAAAAPEISTVHPDVINPGDTITIAGSGFDPIAGGNTVEIGQELGTVLSATDSKLRVSIPTGPSFSGKVTITTPSGTVTGPDVYVAPPGYSGSQIDFVGRLSDDISTTVSLATPNKVGLLLLDLPANHRFMVTLSSSTNPSILVTALAPGGAILPWTSGREEPGPQPAFLGPGPAPGGGTYLILVKGNVGATGKITLTPHTFLDQQQDIVPNGPAATVKMTTPGQRALFSFTGDAGHRVSATLSQETFPNNCAGSLSLENSQGFTLAESAGCATPTAFLGATTLPYTGNYTLTVDPADNTGTASLKLYSFLDQVGAIVPNGPKVKSQISAPGQRSLFEFTGKAGQSVTINLTGGTFQNPCLGHLSLLRPEGSVLASPPTCLGPTESITKQVLPVNGKYTVDVDPGAETGSAFVQLTVAAGKSSQSPRPVGSKARRASWGGPPPQAGNSAIRGVVLRLDGDPLPGVTLRVGHAQTMTDAHGVFLLKGLKAGHDVMTIDGTTAVPHGSWGTFEDGVDLTAGQITTLPYTIWMTRLDTKHTVLIPSPIRKRTVVSNPAIPGLQLVLAPGTVIRNAQGGIVRRLSSTRIPVDQSPFPLPAFIGLPTYFTIQPGDVTLSKGARLIYPNWSAQPPGVSLDFWDYDPAGSGWWIYGQGTVSRDRKQVIPDRGVEIHDFNGAMINTGVNPPPSGPPSGGNGADKGDPVDTGTGLFVLHQTDLTLPGLLPVSVVRTYRQNDPYSRAFGIGTADLYSGTYLWSAHQFSEADLVTPEGTRNHFVRTSPGTSFADAIFDGVSPGPYLHATLAWNGLGWNLTMHNGMVLVYGLLAPLQAIRDRNGNTITITRTNGQLGDVVQVTASSGRWVHFTYDAAHRIVKAVDNTGRTTTYEYNAAGYLSRAHDPAGRTVKYTYDANGRMATITDPRGITYVANTYDGSGRVVKQTQSDGHAFTFAYSHDVSGNVTQTVVTDPAGNDERLRFNSDGYVVEDTKALGTPDRETTAYVRQPGTDFVIKATDPLGRVTSYSYDADGNVTEVTKLAGQPGARTYHYAYDPAFGGVTSVTDPMGHRTVYTYDATGNLVSVTDALGHAVTLTYDPKGEPVTVADALSHQYHLTYTAAGDLTSATDPMGRTEHWFVDGAGRVTVATNPEGESTRLTYDQLSRLTAIVDPTGDMTHLTYDADGNPTSVSDPRGNVTKFSYDSMDRMVVRTDALGHSDRYKYDGLGNRILLVDRAGQKTTYQYDPMGRLSRTTYADGSTTAYAYDHANRVTAIVDSKGGTISRSYDSLDRLIAESTPQGSVFYSYNPAGWRTTMTAGAQPTVDYSYDNAGRLTEIKQGSSTVRFTLDAANRPTSTELPDGVTQAYTYDSSSMLTGITYKSGATTLGDLTYGHDANGQITSEGGSWARTLDPAPVTSATYNADNELTNWNGASLTYDANGNLIRKGADTYAWNARNQLIGVSGSTSAFFAYDALGQRTTKSVGGTTTRYLYDGQNVVQEGSVHGPVTNLLAGLGVDQFYATVTAGKQSSFLTDQIGSTIALGGSSGTVQTQYSYGPFGTEADSGTASSNTIQYAGMQNDSTGFYFDNARFYSPALGRFVSQDPVGLGGGDTNLYRYVFDDPVDLTDPLGLDESVASGILAGAALLAGLAVIAVGSSYSVGAVAGATLLAAELVVIGAILATGAGALLAAAAIAYLVAPIDTGPGSCKN